MSKTKVYSTKNIDKMPLVIKLFFSNKYNFNEPIISEFCFKESQKLKSKLYKALWL